MFWATFTLAFFGFLSCSELTCNGPFDHNIHLTRQDITFVPDINNPQHIKVCNKNSKRDPFRQTALVTIAKSRSNICAVSAARELISYYKHQGIVYSPLSSSSMMAAFSHAEPWPRTYIPYFS